MEGRRLGLQCRYLLAAGTEAVAGMQAVADMQAVDCKQAAGSSAEEPMEHKNLPQGCLPCDQEAVCCLQGFLWCVSLRLSDLSTLWF